MIGEWVVQTRSESQSEPLMQRIPPASSVDDYFAAFKKRIGLYPPVQGDAKLANDVAMYANEKGNLRFPLDQRMPYALIGRLVKARVRENLKRADAQG